jgi:cation diffusion facilitator family transporter
MSAADPTTAVALDAQRGQQRTALLSVFAAAALVTIKLVTGLASGSLGLIAEALHSGTDLVAAVLTFFAIRVAVRPPDREHPYGHGKAEHLAALGEAGFLGLASLYIGYQSVDRLLGGVNHGDVEGPWYALVVLVVVIAIDVSRASISWRASKAYDSPALASNALHFASDLLGSVAVLIGLIFVRAGYPEADAVAALAVAVLVIIAAVRLARRNVEVLMDSAPAAAAEAARQAIARDEPGVDLRRLRVREAAGAYFVDAVVGVRPDAGVGQGHALADAVEAAVRRALPRADVVVHVEPGDAADVRERVNAAALAVRGVREVHNVRVMEVDGSPEVSLHLKLPSLLPLEQAHAITTEVEAAIRQAVPAVSDVHTHIEPLSEARAGETPEDGAVAGERDVIAAVVRELTGSDPEDLRLRVGEHGRIVALLTITVDPSQRLREAHEVATEIEERVRRRAPAISEVVVHTEPR